MTPVRTARLCQQTEALRAAAVYDDTSRGIPEGVTNAGQTRHRRRGSRDKAQVFPRLFRHRDSCMPAAPPGGISHLPLEEGDHRIRRSSSFLTKKQVRTLNNWPVWIPQAVP